MRGSLLEGLMDERMDRLLRFDGVSDSYELEGMEILLAMTTLEY